MAKIDHISRVCGRRIFNSRLTGTPDFPPPTGEVFENPPSSSAPIGRREKRKSVRKLVKNDNETISVKFSIKSKLWPPGAKMPSIFWEYQTSLRKTFIILGNTIAKAKLKTAFERELNFPFDSRGGHQSKKNCYWAKAITAKNFFIFICTATIWAPSCLSHWDTSNYIYGDEMPTSIFDLRSRLKRDPTRLCCISFDAFGQEEHFQTYSTSLSQSNQKI